MRNFIDLTVQISVLLHLSVIENFRTAFSFYLVSEHLCSQSFGELKKNMGNIYMLYSKYIIS